MGRPLRIEYPGALYHITSRGNERKDIFIGDKDRISFLEILSDYHDRYGIILHSYVLMDNHYHLILETPKGNLLKVMHGINSCYTGYFNRRYKRSGHLFQGRYKAIIVDKDAYLLPLSRYLHLNPVRANIVDKPELYRWSGYPGYIGKGRKYNWVEYTWILSCFGDDTARAMKRYKEYTEEALKLKPENPFAYLHGRTVLGREEFKDKISSLIKGKPLSNEIVERKRLIKNPLAEDIMKSVAKAFNVEEDTIKRRGRRNNIARGAAIYFVQRYSGLDNIEIGELFGGIHYSAVTKASMRLKEEKAGNRRLSKLVLNLDSQFKS